MMLGDVGGILIWMDGWFLFLFVFYLVLGFMDEDVWFWKGNI